MNDPKKKEAVKKTVRKVEENLDMDPDSLVGQTLVDVIASLLDDDDSKENDSDDSDDSDSSDDDSSDDFGGGDFGGGGSSSDW